MDQGEVENMRRVIRNSSESFTLDSFGADVIDGMAANIWKFLTSIFHLERN